MPSEAATNELNELLQKLDAKKREIDRQRDAVIMTIRLLSEASAGENGARAGSPPISEDDDGGDSVPW